jgi:Calreticulin family
VPSKWKSADELGDWAWTAGKWHADEATKGIQTSQDSRFYGLIAPLSEPFTQEKDLVLQFSVKHENKLDCGGADIKLLGPDVDTDSFGGDTPYQVYHTILSNHHYSIASCLFILRCYHVLINLRQACLACMVGINTPTNLHRNSVTVPICASAVPVLLYQ